MQSTNKKSVWDWKGEPSIFSKDHAFLGINARKASMSTNSNDSGVTKRIVIRQRGPVKGSKK